MIKTVYKVVQTVNENTYSSLFAGGEFKAYYRLNEIAKAPSIALNHGFGLTVFDDLNLTNDFLQHNYVKPVVLVCNVESEDELLLPPKRFGIYYFSSWGCSFYEGDLTEDWPPNTKMYSKLTPVEVIQ